MTIIIFNIFTENYFSYAFSDFNIWYKKSHAIYFDSSCLHSNTHLLTDHHGRNRIIVGFTNTCAISTYHHCNCVWILLMPRCTRCYILSVTCGRLVGFFQVLTFTKVSYTSKTGLHDITEILLKVALNIILSWNVVLSMIFRPLSGQYNQLWTIYHSETVS